MPLIFTVPPQCDGWRLGDFLRRCGCSLTAVRRAKRTDGGLLLDGAPVHTDAVVRAGQQVCLAAQENGGETPVLPQQLPLRIVYEDAHAAVVEKEAGMAVHPTLNHADGTLANAWMGLLAARGETGVFHPVYRLDKDTSGLLLLAKEAAAQPFLQRSCRKLYAALLQGTPPQRAGTVTAPIGRAPDSVILRRVDPQGQPAVTHYRVLTTGNGCTLAVFRLPTGRTHQIRVHMASLGCPLAGDDLYGGSKSEAFPRQALHCAALRFDGPMGGETGLVSAFPPQLLAAAGMPQAAALLEEYCREWLSGPCESV